ncbi:tyrosine-type recombinase/integrase [Vibrio cyclitrophicus]
MYQKLVKGLAVYRQNHTKSYYVRLRADGKEIKRSLSTSNLEEAISKAWALKFEIEGMIKAGIEILPTKILMIEQACLSVITELENKKPFKSIYKDYILIYRNFIIPFFKKRNIEDLTTKNIRLYFESLELSKTRKTINKTCFTRLFNYLEEENKLKKRDFPTLPKEIKTSQKQIGIDFKDNELKTIQSFISSNDWLNQNNINFKTKEYRLIFPHVFNFLLNTGVRTGEEMTNICFSDIIKDKNNFYIKIRKGKTKEFRQREILLNKKSIESIISIVEITRQKTINKNQLVNIKDGFVFESSFLKIGDWCKLFDQIIKKLILSNQIKNKYTLYSCRHTYITKMLLDGVDMFLISKQVGNSLEMIQRHYDHSLLKDSKNTKALLKTERGLSFNF